MDNLDKRFCHCKECGKLFPFACTMQKEDKRICFECARRILKEMKEINSFVSEYINRVQLLAGISNESI